MWYYCNMLYIQWIDLESNEKIEFEWRSRPKMTEECEYKYEGDMAGKGKRESTSRTWSGHQQDLGKKKLGKYVNNSLVMKKIKKENDFKRKYKGKKYEKETDKLFAGENNNKRRRNKKRKKKKKVLLQTNVYYANKSDIIYGVNKNQREEKIPKSKII